MKAKTVKRLAILIAVLSLVGGTGFYTQQVRVKQTARAEMRKADDAATAGEFLRPKKFTGCSGRSFPKILISNSSTPMQF